MICLSLGCFQISYEFPHSNERTPGMRLRTRLTTAVLLLMGLFVSSVSAAESTVLRWTHPNPSEVTGFRVSIGYASRNYVPQLEVDLTGLTANNDIYQTTIELDESQPLYVSVRAFNDDGTSAYSNERVYSVPLGVPGRPRLTNN
jgi:hypothetical protein